MKEQQNKFLFFTDWRLPPHGTKNKKQTKEMSTD